MSTFEYLVVEEGMFMIRCKYVFNPLLHDVHKMVTHTITILQRIVIVCVTILRTSCNKGLTFRWCNEENLIGLFSSIWEQNLRHSLAKIG